MHSLFISVTTRITPSRQHVPTIRVEKVQVQVAYCTNAPKKDDNDNIALKTQNVARRRRRRGVIGRLEDRKNNPLQNLSLFLYVSEGFLTMEEEGHKVVIFGSTEYGM